MNSARCLLIASALFSADVAGQIYYVAPHIDTSRAGFGRGYSTSDASINAQINDAMRSINQEEQRKIDLYRAKLSAAADARNAAASVGVDARVIAFLKERVANGSADAAADLAERHRTGKGVNVDLVEARRLMQLSVERGNTNGVSWLATNTVPIAKQ